MPEHDNNIAREEEKKKKTHHTGADGCKEPERDIKELKW